MEGEKNCKNDFCERENRSFKKRKIQKDFGKINKLQSNNCWKRWDSNISGVQKQRRQMVQTLVPLCICNLDSNVSLVAYFISSVLLIPFICCILSLLQNPFLQDTQ